MVTADLPILSEDQIERAVERAMNKLDGHFMRHEIDQATYDADLDHLNKWAEGEYARAKGAKRG